MCFFSLSAFSLFSVSFCFTLDNVWHVGSAICSAGPHDVLLLHLQIEGILAFCADVLGYFYSPLLFDVSHEASVTH